MILDGDNVLRVLKLFSGKEVHRAEGFLQRLEHLAVSSDWEIVVIFDGPKMLLPRETGPLVIRYAPRAKTADTVIERLVYEAPDRSEMVVVTQDRAQADLILGLGGRVWSAQRLMEELDR